jgi:protein TonB
MTVRKVVFFIFFGLYVTVALLYIMQSLIQSGEQVLKIDPGESMIEFVMAKEPPQLQIRKRNPAPPPPPDSPPPQAVEKLVFNARIDASEWTMNALVVDQPKGPSGPSLEYTDGDYLPIVQVQPVYPRAALVKGLVGWVLIEFTVTERGTVTDPYIVSNCAVFQPNDEPVECASHPNRIFDTAAIRAALKFKYKPKVINGVATATSGVRNLVTFEFEE